MTLVVNGIMVAILAAKTAAAAEETGDNQHPTAAEEKASTTTSCKFVRCRLQIIEGSCRLGWSAKNTDRGLMSQQQFVLRMLAIQHGFEEKRLSSTH